MSEIPVKLTADELAILIGALADREEQEAGEAHLVAKLCNAEDALCSFREP